MESLHHVQSNQRENSVISARNCLEKQEFHSLMSGNLKEPSSPPFFFFFLEREAYARDVCKIE